MLTINNLTKDRIDRKLFGKVAKIVLKGENIRTGEVLSVIFVTEEKIQELNKKYRKKNKPTDVLSFVGDEDLGEIVICLKQVKKNSIEFKSNFKKESSFILIHGILHLLGYDHEGTKKEAEKMQNREAYYLSKLSF